MIKQLQSFIPKTAQANLMLKLVGLTRIPLLFATGCKIEKLDDDVCVVKMPFRKLNKNHLGSMYFGALSIGADACIGIFAQAKIVKSGEKLSLIFKDFKVDFLKRAEGPTRFVCDEGKLIDKTIEEALATGERVSKSIPGYAMVGDQVVAEFVLTLSLKKKS
ncbi:MAG: DUF4442 domain-containing protein [Bdellovibrionales bacterium]|nr:DUF4442 domain-containing protein [Bdellovibrionales bacterium]